MMILFFGWPGAGGAKDVRTIKTQFFFAYAVMGSMIPFLSIYLKREQALSEGQIGTVLGLAGVSILLTPVLMTLLADTKFDPRRLAACVFGVSGSALLALYFTENIWLVFALLFLHSLAYAAVIPLHDGMVFGLQRRMEQEGVASEPYYHIRVWGSLGFILPSLLFFYFLSRGYSLSIILIGGFSFSVICLLNALRLPYPKTTPRPDEGPRPIPTTQAARVFWQPSMRVFCIALFITFIAAGAFGSFYPLYMAEVIGIEERWVGLIFNFGVVIEIFFMLGFGWLQARLGLRKIIVLGIVCFSLQTALLAAFPTLVMALLAQVLHGIIIVGIYMAPIMFINGKAGDDFRNSIQGLYTVLIIGVARIVGIISAGHLGDVDLRLIPILSSVLAATGALLLFSAFRESEESVEPSVSPAREST
jgi:MFS transporter, PPP family, 3-phenylpropionic acid transporter